ncbi:MAG: beta galactosidase jelly roll domain-containing protein [Ekhidna sp.]
MKFIGLFIGIIISSVGFAQKSKVIDLEQEWKFTIGDREEYSSTNYDDSSWESIYVPAKWEDQGFLNYNGYAWYRISFDGSELEEYKNLLLSLGYIDDVNETYFNGEKIGFKGSFPPDYYTAYDAYNEYQIPDRLINREGKNTIAVKVYDLTLGGGICGGEIAIYFEPKMPNDFFSLEGVWKFSTTRKRNWEEKYYNDEDWDDIVVPSFWRSKHIRNSNGLGWYRTEFVLPENLKDKDLYLVLGQIDDFDYTYINGEIVGRTKDNLSFGLSTSYNEFRIYKISKEKLNQTGSNVIAVQVEDIGGEAGIYDGPVGLATKILSKNSFKD